MKIPILAVLCLLVTGCQMGPYTELYSSDSKGPRTFSRYFENEKFPVGGAVLVDAVISLGHERLPKEWKPEQKLYYSDGEVEAVLEFYFTNLTDKPVELKIEDFQCQLFHGPIGPTVMVIPPKQWVKSTPLVALTSNYVIKPWDYSMSVVIDGKAYPIKDKLARMTIEQLKARHGSKKANQSPQPTRQTGG